MLSFDVSAIDVVLMVAVLVLFVLFVTLRKSQSVTNPQLNMGIQEKLSRKAAKVEKTGEDLAKKRSGKDFQECVHEFGYLKDTPKNAPIPEECFG